MITRFDQKTTFRCDCCGKMETTHYTSGDSRGTRRFRRRSRKMPNGWVCIMFNWRKDYDVCADCFKLPANKLRYKLSHSKRRK